MFLLVRLLTNAVSAKGRGPKNHSIFNTYQLAVLKAAFAINCYLSQIDLIQLAHATGLEEKKISTWFKNERFRTKCKGNGKVDPISGHYFNYMCAQVHVFISS